MQDAQHPGDVELALVGGDIVMPDRGSSRISAGSGHYDGAAETLELNDGVKLVNVKYEVDLRSVRIAFKSGDYVSTEPVTVRILPDATITADAFSALQNGVRRAFRGPCADGDSRPSRGDSEHAMRPDALQRTLAGALALSLCGAAAKTEPVSILPGGDSKKPISIAADKLDYFEKEGRAVYDGHVEVMQGETHLTCSRLTIFMDTSGAAPTPAPAADAASPSADASSKLKHMDCAGPVKVVSKTQTATSDAGTYDKGHNTVVLTGHVVLAEGHNVTTGERLVYDLNTGQAAVQGGGKRVTGRVPARQRRPRRKEEMSLRPAPPMDVE